MNQIELGSPQLFKNLMEFEYFGNDLDLHNDYDCTDVKYLKDSNSIEIYFDRLNTLLSYEKIVIFFTRVEIVKMSLPLQNFKKQITIDAFYRGRFEFEGELYEYSDTGKPYYYVDFYEDYSIEMFVGSVKILLFEVDESNPPN